MEIAFLGDAGDLHPSCRSQIININKMHFAFPTSLLLQAHWWWVARKGGDVVAIAAANDEDNKRIFLGPCGVLPSFRGQGIQHALIRAREEWGRSQGFIQALSCTGVENYYSANNFIRSGYALIPPWKVFTNSSVGLFFSKSL
jgi:GNAT superfamily N-acetyltransferase